MINEASDKVNQVSELVSSKKETILKQTVNVLLLLIILILFGCFDWLHLRFHFEYLLDTNFWINVATKATSDVLSYNIGINVVIDEVIKRNKVLNELKRIYDNLNQYKDKDFDDFVAEYNRECKINIYKNRMHFKIYRLNKFARRKDKLLYDRMMKSDPNFFSDPTQKKNRYCLKRRELEQLSTDEYINANLDTLDVKYREIDPSIFALEINGTQKIEYNRVTGSVNKGRALMSLTTLAGVIAFPIVMNSISLAPSKDELQDGVVTAVNYCIKIAGDIGIIVWQFLRGMMATPKIVSRELTSPLSERVKVLKRYYAWRKGKGLYVPQCYLDLIQQVEYKSIRKQDFDKLETDDKQM